MSLHTKILEKKIEIFKENETAFKIMMNDLENYKHKAEMSKEFATFFSPFSPINQFSEEEMKNMIQVKKGIVNIDAVVKLKD